MDLINLEIVVVLVDHLMQMDLVLPFHLTIMLQELSLIVLDCIEQQELSMILQDLIKMEIVVVEV